MNHPTYECECGARFSAPIECSDTEGLEYFGTPCRQTWMGCPHCYSEDFSELGSCSMCGLDHRIDELENGLCKDCIKALKKEWSDMVYAQPRWKRDFWNIEYDEDPFFVLGQYGGGYDTQKDMKEAINHGKHT